MTELHIEEMRERMAKAVSFAMLGVEDRWKDWLPKADNIIASLAAEVGVVLRGPGEEALKLEGSE